MFEEEPCGGSKDDKEVTSGSLEAREEDLGRLVEVLEQHKNGDVKQQEEIDLHDRTPSMSQGGKQRSPVRNTDVRTVHNSEVKIPIEKSLVNVLMGAGRCTFATNV